MTDGDGRTRIVVLGPGRVGKTSLLRRFVFGTFADDYKETVEDLYCREYNLNGNHIKVDFLDTAGNMEFPAMRRLSISTAHAFVLVYSITSEASFQDMKSLWFQIKEERPNYQDLPCVLVGNKMDLENDRQVEKFDALNWIYQEGFPGSFVEVSAKESDNVADVFRLLYEQSRTGTRHHSAQRRLSVTSLDEADSERCEEWDSDAKKFNRSRSLIRRGSKPKVKKTRGRGKNDCAVS